MKVKLPASVEAAVEELNGIGELLRAREWHKAAIVASFVEVHTSRGRPANTRTGNNRMSTVDFAALEINGLIKPTTIQLYVQRWLDANDGRYPEPGSRVELPEADWPPSRGGTDGYERDEGARRTLDRLIEKHGPDVIAKVVANRPDVAEAVAENDASFKATFDKRVEDHERWEQRQRDSGVGGGRGSSVMSPVLDAMQKV